MRVFLPRHQRLTSRLRMLGHHFADAAQIPGHHLKVEIENGYRVIRDFAIKRAVADMTEIDCFEVFLLSQNGRKVGKLLGRRMGIPDEMIEALRTL